MAKKAKSEYDFVAQPSVDRTGRKKPTKIDFQTIRNLRDLNPLVNVCIETLKHYIVKIPWHIAVKEPRWESALAPRKTYLTELISRPNKQESYRDFWLKVLDDVLTIDRGVIEKSFNAKGQVAALYTVDGATIRPCLDQYGEYMEPAFVQVIQNEQPIAKFSEEEISVLSNSPSTQIGMMGYGRSPVERIILTVLTYINADTFNAGTFTKSSLPPYAVNLPKATKQDIVAFQQAWEANAMGNMWKGIFTNAEGVTIQKLRESNQEMQYFELTQWLSKIIIAAFEMSPQDVGLTMDINKATAESQQNLSKNQGVRNLLHLMEGFFADLVRQLALDDRAFEQLEFRFDAIDKIDEKTQAEIDKIYAEIGKTTIEEMRQRDGQETLILQNEQRGIQPGFETQG